jgi:glutamine amidotransferase
MCRLLYVRSKNPFSITDHLQKFANIARNSKEFQGHGWGCAYLVDNEWKFYKNIKPVWEDDLQPFGSTTVLIAHARSAFRDQDIDIQNNMPFFNGKYVYIFNGELHGVKIKESGNIGAEKIFNFIQRFDTNDVRDALQKGVSIIKKRSHYVKAMNIIIADKEKAYVTSDFNEDSDYFTIHYKKTLDELIISSEKYPGESKWHKLETNKIKVF